MTNAELITKFNAASTVVVSFSLPEGYTLDDGVGTITPTTVFVDTEEVPCLFLLFVLVIERRLRCCTWWKLCRRLI